MWWDKDAFEELTFKRLDLDLARLLADHPGRLYKEVVGATERALLRALIRSTNGNQVQMAKKLGINRTTLRKKLICHGFLGRSRSDRSARYSHDLPNSANL